jgi:hypothetical protein
LKLSTLLKAAEAAVRELGAAGEQHWRVSSCAVAAVKAYDLVAGAAVDANVLKSEGGGVVSAAMDAIDAGVGECVKG